MIIQTLDSSRKANSFAPGGELKFPEVWMQNVRMRCCYLFINFFNIICYKPKFGSVFFSIFGVLKKEQTQVIFFDCAKRVI